MKLALSVTLVALVSLLVAECRRERMGVWLAKPIASAGFVAFAIFAGAQRSAYGLAVFVALALSWVGDVALIRGDAKTFKLGIGAFLLGHLAYIAAFALRGVSLGWTALALVTLTAPALAVARRVLPRVPHTLRMAVAGYIVVITTMVGLALGTFALHGGTALALGAVAFYLSDLSVARDRFIAPGFGNKLWGLPLYYLAQIALGWSVRT